MTGTIRRTARRPNQMNSQQTNIILFFFTAFLIISCPMSAASSGFDVSGRITCAATGDPVPGATIAAKGTGLWAVCAEDGTFTIQNISAGQHIFEISCLGYVTKTISTDVLDDIADLVVRLDENTLALDEVIVTAERDREGMNTTMTFGSNALEHLQMSNVTDIAALLPGGKTVNPDLTSANTISIRDGGLSAGNAAFGTAIEIDGVRLGNNASFGEMAGIGTRNIQIDNIESVEVITGVPSAEYGDLNSGMVRINTRKGRTPVNVTFAVNPRTWSVSAAKGIGLKDGNGVLNVSGEWVRATSQLMSPYTSYTRRGLSLVYSNTFAEVLRFEAGFSGNIGGMNSKDDPDASTGEYTKVRDNVFRANTSLDWLLNRNWITSLSLDASVYFNDNLSHEHLFSSSASMQPAVHAEEQGYFLAGRLPLSYFSDRMTDSKELDYAASVKYDWYKNSGKVRSRLKAGLQWKATGNVGKGEYYLDPSLSENGYRPRPYSDYPYMHNLAAYIEEEITVPAGRTELKVSAGLRLESLFVRNTEYRHPCSLSPRFNAKWQLTGSLAIRGGWGVSEKLPSYYILYPEQQYRDIQTFGFSHGDQTSYIYYTQPYSLLYNENLTWQRNQNSEFGIDLTFRNGFSMSVTGYYSKTASPYRYSSTYNPFSYNYMEVPDGFDMPDSPYIHVDSQTGMVYIRGSEDEMWTPMEKKVTDRTFVSSTYADNGADIHRAGVELIMDFPEIRTIRTKFRIDANYAWTSYIDNSLYWYYQNGWSHTSLPDRSYQYVGIYATGSGANVWNGKRTHSIDANLTAITHIPQARIVITCRLEMSLLKRSRNLSEYNGKEYAFNISGNGSSATGGSIYDGNSYTAVLPVAYMDLDGTIRKFTAENASDPEFASLILRSGNAYTFAQDGYGPYFSANISITKEIGDHVSMSFFANNFTNSRKEVISMATGTGAIFTPDFYYGLTCRLKF